MLLDRLLIAYGLLPHHPGKGAVYDRLLPAVKSSWKAPRLRTRYGVRFECDLADKLTREIYYCGFDRKDCRILKRLVKPGHVVLDAGANVGYFSLLCAKWMHGRGVVHAFEPFPTTAERLTRNLALNPQLKPIITLHRLALSDVTGRMGMSVPDQSNQGRNFLSATGPVNVKTTSIDAFCENEGLARVDLIKVDVEGSEVALLRGAEETIRRHRPMLMIEINPSSLENFGYKASDLAEAISCHAYRLHYAGRYGLKLLQRLPAFGEERNIFAFPLN
jgi:FkbM family methyltransferase